MKTLPFNAQADVALHSFFNRPIEDKVIEDKVIEDKVIEDKVIEDQLFEDNECNFLNGEVRKQGMISLPYHNLMKLDYPQPINKRGDFYNLIASKV